MRPVRQPGIYYTASLADLLSTAHGWNPGWAPNAAYDDTVWLMTSCVPPGRRPLFREDVAARLHTAPANIAFVAPEEAVRNHARTRVLSLNVLAVPGSSDPRLIQVSRPVEGFLFDPFSASAFSRRGGDGGVPRHSLSFYPEQCPVSALLFRPDRHPSTLFERSLC